MLTVNSLKQSSRNNIHQLIIKSREKFSAVRPVFGKTDSSVNKTVSTTKSSLALRQPNSIEDFKDCFNLVYRQYMATGLQQFHSSEMRYFIHQLLPCSQTINVYQNGELRGTGSMVFDSECGLPSGKIYDDELRFLRVQGRKFIEATLLACESSGKTGAHSFAKHLFGASIHYLNNHEVDDYVVVVNPNHLSHWVDGMGFEIISHEKTCGHVKDLPGVLLRYDLKALRENQKEPTPLFKRSINSSCVKEFVHSEIAPLDFDGVAELLALRPEIIEDLTLAQYNKMVSLYPGIEYLWNIHDNDQISVFDSMEQAAA